MPYSFRCVNATYVNAYAFPGGSIAVTRGILLKLENEAELAALVGHELGHVNARHTASQMSKGMLTNAVVGGVAAMAGGNDGLGRIASSLGMLGAGMLLASYSRDNERQADALGLEYMVRTGYGPEGFAGLMDMLRSLSKHNPSTIELMFSTHPMSDERYRTAITAIDTTYASAKGDRCTGSATWTTPPRLRRDKRSIETIQEGETLLAKKKLDEAGRARQALRLAPDDYAGLVTMAKCQFMRKDYRGGVRYAEKAQRVLSHRSPGIPRGRLRPAQAQTLRAAYNDLSGRQEPARQCQHHLLQGLQPWRACSASNRPVTSISAI
jgi:hypothetical protein